MNIPINFKSVNFKDWVWIIGSATAVIGSWFVMGQDVSSLKQAVAKQEVIDKLQNENAEKQRLETQSLIYRTTDEIKEEIRELRRDLKRK